MNFQPSPPIIRGVLSAPSLKARGFQHGFSLRDADVEGQFHSQSSPLFQAEQIHSNGIVVVRRNAELRGVRKTQADGLVTSAPGTAVAVRTADCLPLLLACEECGAVAAVHCGWRGVVANIVRGAIAALRRGCTGAELLAAMGPHIRVGRFEVGEEVVEALQRVAAGAEFVRRDIGPKPHVDLAAVVRAQLQQEGISAIEDVGGATAAEPERFHSYRRDGKGGGRQHSFILARS